MCLRFFCVSVALLTAVTQPAAYCQGRNDVPGMVQLHNGLVLQGICSITNTIDPLRQDQNLELRRIDQGFRDYLVSTRQSARVVPDAQAIPRQNFRIRQRRTSQRPLNYQVGLHSATPFGPDGTARITLNLGDGREVEVDIGIVAVNSVYATVEGLNHQWNYGVALESIPDRTLYAGPGSPAILKCVENFDDGGTRLNLAQMLMDAERYTLARHMLDDIRRDFPELSFRCETLTARWNDQVGTRIVGELEQLRDAGMHETARRYVRRWPDAQLDPLVRVRAKQFRESLETDSRRLNTISQSLADDVGEIADPEVRRVATRIWAAMKDRIDLNTLPRLVPYELLGLDRSISPESRFALAVTGWMLGADQAFNGFPEAAGLFEIRYLIRDYVTTTDSEDALRSELLDRIRVQEGFTPERVAQLIRHLPPTGVVQLDGDNSSGTDVEFTHDNPQIRCVVRLPPEYRDTRAYPLLIAFPRGGLSAEDTREWWQAQTDRHGYVLAVPELYGPDAAKYDASVTQHQQFLSMLRHLKTEFMIDDDRVFLAGHGIGGEAALDLGTAHPDLFSGVATLAGLGRRHIQWTAQNFPELPVYVVVGTRQPSYFARMDVILERLLSRMSVERRPVFCNAVLVRYANRGFESYAEEIPNLFRWMNLQRRPAMPDYINATTLRSTDTSWFWIELEEIPDRFVGLNEPGTAQDAPQRKGTVAATVSRNLIRVRQLPGTGTLRLAPGIPEVDFQKPLSVRFGTRQQRIDYKASARAILDSYRDHGDRKRLTYMNVPLRK